MLNIQRASAQQKYLPELSVHLTQTSKLGDLSTVMLRQLDTCLQTYLW